MFLARAALPLLLLTGLTACDTATAPTSGGYEAAQDVTVKGQLTYRERIALPADARAVLTLSDVSIADKKAPVIKRKIIELDGQQVPIRFSLKTDPGKLIENRRYSLRGTIIDTEDQLLWTTDTAHMVKPDVKEQNLGELRLVRVEPRPALRPDTPDNKTVYYDCDGRAVQVEWDAKHISMSLDGKTMKLPHVVSASGSKYEKGEGVDRHMFWTKGDDATLDIGDETYKCKTATKTYPGKSALTGKWIVTDINGTDVLDNTDVTLNFTDEGKLNGSTGCNNYGGTVEAKNIDIRISQIFQTKRACPGGIGEQETRFTELLRKAVSYKIDGDKLVLKTENGKTVTARR